MVPDIHDETVQRLLAKIKSPSKPGYVPVRVESYAKTNEFFPNVERKVEIEGGEIVYGWKILKGKLICDAEFHAVWKSDSGVLIDITPKNLPEKMTLFIQDNRMKYKGKQVDNIRISCIRNLLVNDLIDIHKALFRIRNRGERAFIHEIKLSGKEAQIYNELDYMNKAIQHYILQGGQLNTPCYCGNERNYSMCHRNELESLIFLSKTF